MFSIPFINDAVTRESSGQPTERRQIFDRALAREILKSEQLRVGILTTLLTGVLLLYLLVNLFFPGLYERIFHGRLPVALFAGILVAIIAYELLVWMVIRRATTVDTRVFTVIRYANAFEETSIPTLGILFMSTVLEPRIYALVTPLAFLYFLFIALSSLRLDVKLCVFTTVIAAVEYLLVASFLLLQTAGDAVQPSFLLIPLYHLEVSGVLLISGLITALVTYRIEQSIFESMRVVEERDRIVQTFGQHVSPAIVDRLLQENVSTDDEIREVCVMFLDIRDFTAWAERREPTEVIDYLNTLFSFMIDIINEHDGVINKFLGDGFMAVFGAPIARGNAGQKAVDAGRKILAELEARTEEERIPPTDVGIGVHAGRAVTGHVGSSRRREYTIIGDVVNVAARLEALNKRFGSKLLVSDAVWKSLDDCHACESIGQVSIKGHEAPVRVYRIV